MSLHGTIRDYEIEEQIGEGGFGAVYKACQLSVQRDVALKIILPQFANNPEFISRFDAEARIIARLEHAHIVPLYDYWREAGAAYLVMRWLPHNLRAILNGEPLALPAISRIMDQVGSALNAAHRKGIIHRDIKPDNILLDDDGNVYLADFGIAQSDSPVGDEHARDEMVGSPAYASPEQLTNGVVTQQSDIYSLGVVLYELLIGERPFERDTNAQTIINQLQTRLPLLSSKRPDLPNALDTVIQRATAKAPEDRYPDIPSMISEFHDSINATLSMISIGNSDAMPRTLKTSSPSKPKNGTPPTRALLSTDGVETFIFNDKRLYPFDLRNDLNPYVGLRAFEESDFDMFYGRDKLVGQLVEQITNHSPFIAIVGPVGSGKSSVLHAGLIPALRRVHSPGRWFVTVMEPGRDPLVALSYALASVATEPYPNLLDDLRADEEGLTRAVKRIVKGDDHLVLVIDHFEELFGLFDDEPMRTHIINSLYRALVESFSHFRLVVSMRADYYDKPLLYKNFGEMLHRWTEVVLPLSPDDLEQAIIKPAEQVGVTVEHDLVQAILQDAYQQSGLLPLLQYTLSELFERRDGNILTAKAYRELGGISGALAGRAEEIYSSLDSAGQRAAQQLFLRLITPDGSLNFTRRRVLRPELALANEDSSIMDHVIKLFSQSHLLTAQVDPETRIPTVEIAHDMLFHTWTRLRGWLEDSRDELHVQQRLTIAAAEWVNGNYNDSFLPTGLRLAQFEAMASEGNVALTTQEKAYLQASIQMRATHGRTLPSDKHGTGDGIKLALIVLFGVVILRRGRAIRT